MRLRGFFDTTTVLLVVCVETLASEVGDEFFSVVATIVYICFCSLWRHNEAAIIPVMKLEINLISFQGAEVEFK